jgi:hypothetical protein
MQMSSSVIAKPATRYDPEPAPFASSQPLFVNYKIKPSFATTDKMYFILCSLQSRHVSALTSGHLQVILVVLNIKIEVTIHYYGSVESNGIYIYIYIGKIAVVYVKVAK